MKVYLVTNEDLIIVGGFTEKNRSLDYIEKIGLNMWNETWDLKEIYVDSLNMGLILKAIDGLNLEGVSK